MDNPLILEFYSKYMKDSLGINICNNNKEPKEILLVKQYLKDYQELKQKDQNLECSDITIYTE